ncbi:hypothetical protein ACHAWF_008565 [Thalassiosira exigua]
MIMGASLNCIFENYVKLTESSVSLQPARIQK